MRIIILFLETGWSGKNIMSTQQRDNMADWWRWHNKQKNDKKLQQMQKSGAIQVLHNAMGGGVKFPENTYGGIRFNIISITRRCKMSRENAVSNTRMALSVNWY